MPSAKKRNKSSPLESKKGESSKKQTKHKVSQNKSHVNEMVLFQNSNLLNQQDPIEQLHHQIDQMIQDDDFGKNPSKKKTAHHQLNSKSNHQQRNIDLLDHQYDDNNNINRPDANQQSSALGQHQLQAWSSHSRGGGFHQESSVRNNSNQDVLTVKKGVLWQQQNYDQFHRRLFSRWKKRYFILTTDYLVCFKRSASRVGHSEMGQFLNKIALSDITKTAWMKPGKKIKGPIVLHINNQYNQYLWSKHDSDDWMFFLNESIERLKLRKITHTTQTNGQVKTILNSESIFYNNSSSGLYENAVAPKISSDNAFINECANDRRQTAMIDGSKELPGFVSSVSSQFQSDRKPTDPTSDSRGVSMIATKIENHLEDTRGNFEEHSHNHVSRPIEEDSTMDDRPRLATEQVDLRSHKEAKQNNSDEMKFVQEVSGGDSKRADQNRATDNQFAEANKSSENKASEMVDRCKPIDKPATSLIRRDESWQSLVSLTHVGRTDMQNFQNHATYTRQRLSTNGRFSINGAQGELENHSIDVRSTATPLRERFPIRQHSMQAAHPMNFPPFGTRQQHSSLDVPPQIPEPIKVHNNQQSTSSHQRKLMQLQLLQNVRNVDYLRGNMEGNRDNDYQVYGPESIATTNHYGYYSMRSNLKSAASEFSFIRPNSSSFQQQQQITPLRSAPLRKNPSYILSEQDQHQNCRPLVMKNHSGLSDANNNNHIASPPTQSCDIQEDELQQRVVNRFVSAELCAPNRELPTKPNKKRIRNNDMSSSGANSFGSGIVCFFKRAFSRRSKRRPKLAESCSSSLVAFGSNHEQIQIAQSAFSTGSKSAKDERKLLNRSVDQPHRMIDLIEAFANKTAIDHLNPLADFRIEQRPQESDHRIVTRKTNDLANIRPKLMQRQFSSPLHKSNSISTAAGFNTSNDQPFVGNHRYMAGDNQLPRESLPSPLISRSTKVMSANLTPLYSRKEILDHSGASLMSPRNSANIRYLPRPSSIYGQPSLISSPINHPASLAEDNFSLQRGSLHESIRLRGQYMESRRQIMSRVPLLDTTNEILEEMPSPASEIRELLPREQLYDHEINMRLALNNGVRTSFSNIENHYKHQRQAVVNPILQSPTIRTIYDNHNLTLERRYVESGRSNQNNHDRLDPNRDSSGYSQPIIMTPSRFNQRTTIITPILTNDCATKSTDDSRFTPTRDTRSQSKNFNEQPVTPRNGAVFVRNKPAAMVAPTTPNREFNMVEDQRSNESTNILRHVSPMRTQQTTSYGILSNVASRSDQGCQANYQHSPLVNGRTRLERRVDGVQTTVISRDQEPKGSNSNSHTVQGSKDDTSSITKPPTSSTMAHRQSETADIGDKPKTFQKKIVAPLTKSAANSSSNDEESSLASASSSSTSKTISIDRQMKLARVGNIDEKNTILKQNEGNYGERDKTSSSRESSAELSGELSSHSGSIDEPDDKNWINSKLVQ